MRCKRMIIFSIFALFVFICVCYVMIFNCHNNLQAQAKVGDTKNGRSRTLTIAAVACGQRLQDTITMIKSALLFNKNKDFLFFIVITENNLVADFQEKLGDWRVVLGKTFDFEILPLMFPIEKENEWRSLFKPCASQRLFLPSILPTIDSLLYVDTDIIFLSPVSDTWSYFGKFNATQMAALTPEHEDENSGWYNRFARHPYYGKLGVNSGVMLMNLTRMRDFGWESHMEPIYTEYKLRITWGDQDIINILFYFYPEKLFVMPCHFNYRPDHCMYMSVCNVTQGIKIMHGNRGYFQSKKQPLFRCLYEAVENYQIGRDPYSDFLVPLFSALDDPSVLESNCGVVSKNAIKSAKELFINEYNYYK